MSGPTGMAERAGFEPAVRCRTHDFQSCTFDHSVTSPGAFNLAPQPRFAWQAPLVGGGAAGFGEDSGGLGPLQGAWRRERDSNPRYP